MNQWRVGGSLGTTIYRGERHDQQQPVAMVFNLPVEEAQRIAERIVAALNGSGSEIALTNGYQDRALKTERENAALRKALADAPHDMRCRSQITCSIPEHGCMPCDCWKARTDDAVLKPRPQKPPHER